MSDIATPAKVPHRLIITICAVGATLIQTLDQTIANVALPYMQGSLSAAADEITWVLTSYITASAIMTGPVGWLSARFGRKPFFITCLVGFTAASMMCGGADSLEQMVFARILQGSFGAALIPLSQALMMDIYPPEQRGQAMAIWGAGVVIGPILGPTLGGYLTEFYNWRFVFYVNLPLGILAVAGLVLFMPRTHPDRTMRFDLVGFTVLSAAIGGVQMMLDRGNDQDWFSSPEIIVEAVIGGLGFYLFAVHMLTARRPFIPPPMFRDRNFSMGLVLTFLGGTVLISTSALMAPWLQNLANYPVLAAGLIMAPRGFGTMTAMLISGRVLLWLDPRYLIAVGLLCISWSVWSMTAWTPDIAPWRIIVTLMIQGGGLGLLFIPLQVIGFSTLPAEYRTDGASLYSLVRNIGSAAGISITTLLLVRNTQTLHAEIGSLVTPFHRGLQHGGAIERFWDPATRQGAALLDHVITHQAQVIAYVNDYAVMIFATLPALLLLPLMRRPRLPGAK